jgi:N-acyl amino acid synthase of PEP-CTERM/exosortase system
MLSEHFDRYFELLPIRDDAMRDEVFRLRYAVYCEELGYESCDAFPDKMERDGFDEGQSIYAMLRHRPTDSFAACVRLVLDRGDDEAFRFPFELACDGRLEPSAARDLTPSQRRRSGEISRLAIHGNFRRRTGEWHNPEGVGDASAPVAGAERRQALFPLSLFLVATALALNRGLDQIFVMMEPRLARLLVRSGIRFTQVGDVIEHHGQRAPFCINPADVPATLTEGARELTAAMRVTLG